jgi:hypothetical protein
MQAQVLKTLLQHNTNNLPVQEFLQQLTQSHPYYAPAHFFLLQHLKENDAMYATQAATTSLLFNNPYWLHFQLKQTHAAAPVVPMFATHTAVPNVAVSQPEPTLHVTLPHEAATEILNENITTAEDKIDKAVLPVDLPKIPAAADEETIDTDIDTEDVTSELPKINLAASIKNAENLELPAFEPMHMVDYFASQGINLSEEVLGSDKLGKQLKSFTEWLKTMKKTPAATTTVIGGEIAVQAQAEKSNTENEVLTEAMAIVFAQQGKADKAIELYQKLSLLNPLKSAYFAAEIEKLKGA